MLVSNQTLTFAMVERASHFLQIHFQLTYRLKTVSEHQFLCSLLLMRNRGPIALATNQARSGQIVRTLNVAGERCAFIALCVVSLLLAVSSALR